MRVIWILGFTDDVILNSRYAHIGDVWFNSKRMCYLGGFTGVMGEGLPDPYFSLRQMELEISLWKERNVQVRVQFWLSRFFELSFQHNAAVTD